MASFNSYTKTIATVKRASLGKGMREKFLVMEFRGWMSGLNVKLTLRGEQVNMIRLSKFVLQWQQLRGLQIIKRGDHRRICCG